MKDQGMQIIYRLCDAEGKNRPSWFSKQACLASCAKAFAPNNSDASWHLICDGVSTETVTKAHELLRHRECQFVFLHERDNARSCRRAMGYAIGLQLPPDEVLYFVEDDYLHREHACAAVLEGLSGLEYDYVTLYDHPDMYRDPSPNILVSGSGEVSRVRCGSVCHWKSTKSTTMTFATTKQRLMKDWNLMRNFIKGKTPSDFWMWRALIEEQCVRLGSSIPGYATHVEENKLGPLWNWEKESSGG
jgi:hypothetical protein